MILVLLLSILLISSISAHLTLKRPSDPSFTLKTVSTHDYFDTTYPKYTFSSCLIVGLHAVKDPMSPERRPQCIVRAEFEEDPVEDVEGKDGATSDKGWNKWVGYKGCRAMYIEWREGKRFGCRTYGHIARAALLRLPKPIDAHKPDIIFVGNPRAAIGYNGGPYLDPYRFPDIVTSAASTEEMAKQRNLTASLERPPNGVKMAIVPPMDARWISKRMIHEDEVISDDAPDWIVDVVGDPGPWNRAFQSTAYAVILWILFGINVAALAVGFGRVLWHVVKRTFDWKGQQTIVFYLAVLGAFAHLGEVLIIIYKIPYESLSHAISNMLLTWAYVALLWIWHLRLRAAGLSVFRGSWFFIGNSFACALLTAIRTMVNAVGASTHIGRTQAKLVVRVLLGPTQIVCAIGLIVYALRFRYGGGKSVRGRLSEKSRVAMARITVMAFLGALGFAILAAVNSLAVDYGLLAEYPKVLVGYYCLRYVSSTVRAMGLLVGLRLDDVGEVRYIPRRRSTLGGSIHETGIPVVGKVDKHLANELGLEPEDFEDDWDPDKTYGPPSVVGSAASVAASPLSASLYEKPFK